MAKKRTINIFDNSKKTVQTDNEIWIKSGCIYIEIKKDGKPSGISTSKSEWWIYCLNDKEEKISVIAFRVKILKEMIKKMVADNKASIVKSNNVTAAKMPLSNIWANYEQYHPLYYDVIKQFNGKKIKD
jgi:regulation of enolase protein 1 (concanavalin A-like superfamily)|tara:strand:+ start:416 stop:802 length:387 start_codon:yes stop_codon:yes gene_type:complete